MPEEAGAAIIDRAQNHWLITKLLADAVLDKRALDLARLPMTVNEAYALGLDQAGAADAWRTRFSPVLGPLAVAGAGPVLPLALLVHASAALGGPSDAVGVHEVLGALRGLVARRDSSAPNEHAGLFHPTLAEYLLSPEAILTGFAIAAQSAHRALAVAIDILAPGYDHDVHDSLRRYAFLGEADHWWALGEFDRALRCLSERESNSPSENRDRWRRWHARIVDQFGRDHPHSLATRSNIAYWTGETGDAREASLRLFQALLPDVERMLGREHPITLRTRNNIASWTGESGDAREALRLFQALLPDRERVLGRDHPDTLTTRRDIASWSGYAGDVQETRCGCIKPLLPLPRAGFGDRARRDSRHAAQTALHPSQAGWAKPREALRLFHALLPERERVFGRDHPGTYSTRNNIAASTGESGDPREALRLFQALLQDQAACARPWPPRHTRHSQ